MRSTGSGHGGRRAAAAAGGLALAAALLTTASPAGAAALGSGAGPLTSAGVVDFTTPATWNGTDLVTTQIDPNGDLYAYEQVPGAASWKKQTVKTAAANGGVPFGLPSITATASAVQIVVQDSSGNLWFFQQADGQTTWSAAQLVSSDLGGNSNPRIAWTGVPGHAGTNSVITSIDESGDVLFWYQNGGGWSEQTVATVTIGKNAFYSSALTATDKGIVIVASGSNGAFYSFYQPYGGSGWTSDGTVGVHNRQQFVDPSVTWDGTHVAVAAGLTSGNGQVNPATLQFLSKSDTDQFWSDEDITGPSAAQPLANVPDIAYTGSNLVIAAVQQTSSTVERLDFWWQGTTFTNFNFEKVSTGTNPTGYGPPALVSTNTLVSSGEVAIVAPYTTNDFTTMALADWTQPVGGTGWTKHTVTPA